MALSAVLGVVATAAVAALVIMVGLAGGWRGEPRAAGGGAGQPWPRTPQQAAFTLRWRATWVTEIIRASLLVIIGLTPAGVAPGAVGGLAPGGRRVDDLSRASEKVASEAPWTETARCVRAAE